MCPINWTISTKWLVNFARKKETWEASSWTWLHMTHFKYSSWTWMCLLWRLSFIGNLSWCKILQIKNETFCEILICQINLNSSTLCRFDGEFFYEPTHQIHWSPPKPTKCVFGFGIFYKLKLFSHVIDDPSTYTIKHVPTWTSCCSIFHFLGFHKSKYIFCYQLPPSLRTMIGYLIGLFTSWFSLSLSSTSVLVSQKFEKIGYVWNVKQFYNKISL